MSKTRKLKKDNPLTPHKYYAGLTRKQAIERRKEIIKFGAMNWRNPLAYKGFNTDKYGKRRTSSYTIKFRRLFPHARSLTQKANATGVPLKYLMPPYNRGLAAWRTGHRPGATPQQWGYARVHSFLLCGKTHYGPDSDIVRAARKGSISAKKWFTRCVTRKKRI